MNSNSLQKWEDSVVLFKEQSAELNVARDNLKSLMAEHIMDIFKDAKSVVFADDFSVIEVRFGVYSDVFLSKTELGNVDMDMEITIGKDHQMYSVVVLLLYPFGRESDI